LPAARWVIHLPEPLLLHGRGLIDGTAHAEVLHLDEPLNVWGGLDPTTGNIVHRLHPQYGRCVTGTVLVLPETRGSGTNAQVVAQAMANGVGPAAVVLGRPDTVVVAGLVVGRELYGHVCPTAVLTLDALDALHSGLHVRVEVNRGSATITG
jgi:predicted aconitase with swiveling domain